MCGIAGILRFDGGAVREEVLEGMISLLRHRGPDERGTFRGDGIGLAHARLSIIDLEGGRQPIANEDGTLQVVFNGEIFNYKELREDLLGRGHRFRTRTDTEVILHLYEEKGEECVRDFNGQWAFALWDAKERKLFVSRDPHGIRPFHYFFDGKVFVFASEVKAIFQSGLVERALDLKGLDQIFTLWTTIPPRTVFKNIRELPPGHSMTVAGGRVAVRSWWDLDFRDAGREMGEEECAERLRDLLVSAVRLRMRADVPVGAYLSGGLDSSLTTALIRKFTDAPLETFSVTFEDAEYDESSYQRAVIDRLGTEHHSVRCTREEIGSVFPSVMWHAEKPVVRTAPAPLFLLSRKVRERGFKVVITGEGADELLGGYDIYKEAKIRRFWGARPDSRLRPLLLKRLYPYLGNIQAQPEAYRRAFFHVRPEDLSNPFFSHLPRWGLTARLKLFYNDAVKSELEDYDIYDDLRGLLPAGYLTWDYFSRAQYLETRTFLPGYLLSSQGDRVAMAHSVEGRFPFLDPEVAGFAADLPPRFRMKGLCEKYILKKAAGDLVPPAVKKRPKQPYRAPEAVSFFKGGGGGKRLDYVEELLSPGRVEDAGIFDAPAVTKLMDKVRRGGAIGIKDNMAFVAVLSTQLVAEQFLKNFRKWSNHETD